VIQSVDSNTFATIRDKYRVGLFVVFVVVFVVCVVVFVLLFCLIGVWFVSLCFVCFLCEYFSFFSLPFIVVFTTTHCCFVLGIHFL
jgi:hypothetical protein